MLSILMEFNKIIVFFFSSFFAKSSPHSSSFLQKPCASLAFLKILSLLALSSKTPRILRIPQNLSASCASSTALRISPFPQILCTLIQNLCTCLRTSMPLNAQLKSAAAKLHAVPDICRLCFWHHLHF